MNDKVKNLGTTLFLFLIFGLISSFCSAQQTCASRKEAGESTSVKYTLNGLKDRPRREVVLSCTEQEDVVKVVLRDLKNGHVVQSFQEKQVQTYLEAFTPDLDNDGSSDFVLVNEWGSPNMTFKAWRYDPRRDRLSVVLNDAGTEFVRTQSDDVVVHAKDGADSWRYTVFKWKKDRLVRAYSIEEKTGDSSECTYSDISNPSIAKPVKDLKALSRLKSYCELGGAGLVERGVNLLQK